MQVVVVIFFLLFSITELRSECALSPCPKKVGKVDVVYTWVDGSDPAWEINYLKTEARKRAPLDAKGAFRFRNHDELKYSLRSIYKYASFVNHIYIVTANQRPKWLKKHPKVSVVSHEEIFSNKDHLPTFNSLAIEANLHHIPNLKECYIYFNDDVFLGGPVSRHDFFSKKGKGKVFMASWISPDGIVVEEDSTFTASWKNANALLNRLFGNKKRYALEHAPFAFRRSQMIALEKCMPSVFKKVSSHKFRSQDDPLLTAGFCQHFLESYGLVEFSAIQAKVVNIQDDLTILNTRPTTFCIEDDMVEETPEYEAALRSFLEGYFPEKAPWEH